MSAQLARFYLGTRPKEFFFAGKAPSGDRFCQGQMVLKRVKNDFLLIDRKKEKKV